MSVRFRVVAIFNRIFLVVSPAYRLDVVGVGGAVRILMMSSATCLKKISVLTFRNETTFGKKVTVSIFRTDLVLGSTPL